MRRPLALVLAIAAVATVLAIAPAAPAGAATIPTPELASDLDVTVDGNDRLVAAWIEVVQEPFERELHLARTQPGSATLDSTFDGDGTKTVQLELPSGWSWTGTTGLIATIEAIGFDAAGNLVLVWFAAPGVEDCYDLDTRTYDNCSHSEDRLVIDRYSATGARLSRSAQLVPPANTWCYGGQYQGDNGCWGDEVNPIVVPFISVLDNGAVALRTVSSYTITPGKNQVRFYRSTDGATLQTIDTGSRRAGFTYARGADGAVINADAGKATNAAITTAAWSATTTTSLAALCTVTGNAATTTLLRACYGGSAGTMTVTRLSDSLATDWERTVSETTFPPPFEGGGAVLKVDSTEDQLVRFGSTGAVATRSLSSSTFETYTAPVAMSGTKVGVGRIAGDATSVALFVEDLAGTTPATVPSKPAKPTAVPGTSKVTLSWTAPGDGGSPITGYRITPYKAGVAQTPVDVGVLTSKEIASLTNGTAYRFTIAARNAIGLGPASDLSDAVTPASVPGAPTNVVAVAGKGSATVTWAPPASNGGSPITGYKIELIDDGVSLQNITVGNVTSWVVPNLFRGNVYTFRVAAVNAIGTGPSSATSNPVVIPPAGFSGWAAAASRQFQDLLGRPPTTAETSTWVPQLQSGATTLGALPAALRTSTDHTGNVDPVTRLYSAYLGRIPDRGGLGYWIGKKRTGTRLTAISSNFAASSEFKRKYGSLTNRAFVELVYQNVLGRAGDASGITYWTNKLTNGTATRGQVMVGFSESNEYKRKQAERVTAIVLYSFLLGRAPTTTEVDTAVAALEADGTVTELADQILDSAAYATRIGSL